MDPEIPTDETKTGEGHSTKPKSKSNGKNGKELEAKELKVHTNTTESTEKRQLKNTPHDNGEGKKAEKQTTEEEMEEWHILYRYNPTSKEDMPSFQTLAAQWKMAPGEPKKLPPDDVVHKLLEHTSMGKKLRVGTVVVSVFPDKPRRPNGLCVGEDQNNSMEVWIEDIEMI